MLAPLEAQSSDALYEAGRLAFQDGLWGAASGNFEQLLLEFPEDPRADGASYLNAVALLKNNKYSRALEALKQFSKRYPQSVYGSRAAYWEGRAHYLLGDWDAAAGAFARQTQVNEDKDFRTRAFLYWGGSLENLGRGAQAAKVYQQYIAWETDETFMVQGRYRLGLVLLGENRAQEALDALLPLVLDYPDIFYQEDILYWLGECRYQLGQKDEALSRYQGFLDTPGDSPYRGDAYLKTAGILTEQSRPSEALEALKHWEEEVPAQERKQREGEVLRLQAALALHQRDWAQAREAYQAVLEKPRNPHEAQRAAYDLAQTWLGTGDALKALIPLDQAAEGPDSEIGADALWLGGTLLLREGRTNQGLQRLSRLIEAYPRHSRREESLRLLVRYYRQSGRGEEAAAALERLLRDYPSSKERGAYLYLQGKTAKEGGKEEEALAAYTSLLREAPHSPWAGEALLETGLIYAQRGEYIRAADYYVKAADQKGSSSFQRWALFSAALAYHNAGRKKDSLPLFSRLISQDPQGKWSPEAAYYRGEIHYDEGRWKEARASYQLAVDNGSPDTAYEALFAMGWTWYRESFWQASALNFSQAALLLPRTEKAGHAYYRAGVSMAAVPDWAAAQGYYRQALAAPGGSWREEALYQQAWTYYQLQLHEDAQKSADLLAREFPRSPLPADLPFRMGEDALARKDWSTALRWYDNCAREFPQSTLGIKAALRAAWVTREMGLSQAAAGRYQSWIAAHPEDPEAPAAARSWGETLRQTGDPLAALTARKAVRPLPLSIQSPLILAWARVSGDPAAAGEDLKRLAQEPSIPAAERGEALLLLAKLYQEEGKPVRARDLYQVVIRDIPQRLGAEAQEGLASTYLQEGREKEALEAYQTLPYLYPDQKEVSLRALREAEKIQRERGNKTEAEKIRQRREKLELSD